MEGEGLVLALIAVREAHCHRRHVSCPYCHFVFPWPHRRVFIPCSCCCCVVVVCLCCGMLLPRRHGVSSFHSRLVVALCCVIFCTLVPSFDGQVTRGC